MSNQQERQSEVTAAARRGRPAWLQTLVAIPAVVLPLLPSATCPVCLAAYAAVLSSVGLGFVFSDSVQRPLIVFFLTVTLGSVAWSARQHRRFGPLAVVLCGSVAIVAARIAWDIRWLVYLGVVCLVVGPVWNLVSRRARRQFVQIDGGST